MRSVVLQVSYLFLAVAVLSVPVTFGAGEATATGKLTLESFKARYERLADKGGWPVFEPGRTVKRGDTDPRIPTLRAILNATGDLNEPHAPDGQDALLYDESLQAAVERFQLRHGLKPDGDIGKATQTELAVPVEMRLAQIEVTLERMQQTEPQLASSGGRYVLVNIPGFYLNAVDGGKTVMTSRVIVGSPKTPTPLFDKEITEISFNPAWHVPARIARNEILVKEQAEPGYLASKGYEVRDETGERIDPELVGLMEDTSGLRLRQPPGAGNALGKIKFNIPNDMAIYLHSTSAPKLFGKDYRALSHGCVRVERTRELAHFALGIDETWSAEKIDRTYDSSTSRIVKLSQSVPVYLVYWPVWVDEETATVRFHPDIYGKTSTRVAELMQARNFSVAMQ